jgi:hypothetical protein
VIPVNILETRVGSLQIYFVQGNPNVIDSTVRRALFVELLKKFVGYTRWTHAESFCCSEISSSRFFSSRLLCS